MIRFFILIAIFNLVSCSSLSKKNKEQKSKKVDEVYVYRDPTGQYKLTKEVNLLKDKSLSYTTTKLFAQESTAEGNDKSLEDSIAISKIERFKLKESEIHVLNPYISQHTIWLDGKKYLSQIKADLKSNKLEIIATDEKTDNLKKEVVDLPRGDQVFCFYSQLEECIKVTGFIEASKKRKTGLMSFYLIFDSYPFMTQNISGDVGPIVKATFQYDGAFENQDIRYELKFAEEVVTYQFDKNNSLVKKNWVSQGVSQEKNFL